jgi:hypothetical protein
VSDLKKAVEALHSRIDTFESQIKAMEEKCDVIPVVPSSSSEVKTTLLAVPTTREEVDEEDNVDLFGSDSEVCLMCK